MSAIYNFFQVSDRLACAGQPGEGQLQSIAADGYKTVINLGLADGKYALNDEAASVKALGMNYYHIPVLFDSPQTEDLDAFIALMHKHGDEKIFVHCAANYRASVFTGLYLFVTGGRNEDALHDFIGNIWQPDPVWESFVEEAIETLRA